MTLPSDAAPITSRRYAVCEAIGSGGMATVHLGRLWSEDGFGRTVAFKKLRAQFVSEPEVVASFVDEARLAARIRHPNVVATIDVVTKDGEVLLVMEYIDGESLASLVRSQGLRDGRVPPAVAVAIIVDALHGLHAAHEAVGESGESLHIVHRDVSPQNILVGVDGIARVLDFGVAKALGRQQTTRDGRIKGTLGHMAPEQLSGRGVTRRTDTFAVGILLWELLTNRRLFRAKDDAETLTRVLFEPVLPPSKVCPGAPAALDPIVMRALERDPTRRFPTAREMIVALEQVMTPATARVVGEWVRSVAADGLDERARRVRDIERRLANPPAAALNGGGRIRGGIDVDAVEPRLAAPGPRGALFGRSGRSGARTLAAAAATSLVLVALGTSWAARDTSPEDISPEAPAAAPAVVAATTTPFVAPSSAESGAASALPAGLPSAVAANPRAAGSAPAAAPTPRPSPQRIVPRSQGASLPVGSARERLYSQD
jgi:hypothetical protein